MATDIVQPHVTPGSELIRKDQRVEMIDQNVLVFTEGTIKMLRQQQARIGGTAEKLRPKSLQAAARQIHLKILRDHEVLVIGSQVAPEMPKRNLLVVRQGASIMHRNDHSYFFLRHLHHLILSIQLALVNLTIRTSYEPGRI